MGGAEEEEGGKIGEGAVPIVAQLEWREEASKGRDGREKRAGQ